MRWMRYLTAMMTLLAPMALHAAKPAPAPVADPVILTVSGKITHYTNPERKIYEFRESDIAAFPQHSIRTKTSWTPESTFTGPLMQAILDKVGATGTKLFMVAVDDYTYTVPASDFKQYPAVFAHTLNGKRMDIRHRGPFWLMYPIPSMPNSAKGPKLDAKLVWQVNRIILR